MHTAFTIDIGGTKCAAGFTTDTGVTALKTWPTAGSIENLEIALQHFIDSEIELRQSVDAIGVCFGGPINHQTGVVERSVHVPGWEGFDFKSWAQSKFDLPLAVDNDANIGALAELHHGGHNTKDLLYVTISTGIGAGVIQAGQVVRGATNDAGELGHTRLPNCTLICACGRTGCLERMCSGYWIEQDSGKPATELFVSDEFLANYSRNLAAGLANAVLLLNPEVVVLGGGVSRVGNRLVDSLTQALKIELGSWQHLTPRITISAFDNAGVHRGVQALTRELFS
jgi:glucokinase